MQFEPGRAEGFCQIEGIYVEVIGPPPPPAERPPLVRAEVLAATKRDLQQLCRAYGLRVSGNKTDLLTRLLRYMDEHGIDLPPEELLEGAGEPSPAIEPPVAEEKRELDRLLTEAEALVEETRPAPSAEAVLAAEAVAEAREPEGVDVEPEVPTGLPPTRAQQAVGEVEEPAERAEVAHAPSASRLRRDRIAFYSGTVLAAAGLIGLLLGAILHDLLRVPLFGTSYEAFGPLNVTASLLGGLLLAAGIAGIGVGLHGGVLPRETATGG